MALPVLGAIALWEGAKWVFNRVTNNSAAAGVIASVFRNVPQLEDEVTVEILGQPGASKQELYFLALAAANGMVRRRQPLLIANPLLVPTMGAIMIEYDAADHWVRCTIRYKVGMVSAGLQSTTGGFVGTAATIINSALGLAANIVGGVKGQEFMDQLAVYRGPPCNVVGGTFDFLDTSVLAGSGAQLVSLPGVPSEKKAPHLPFAGSMILTSCPTTVLPQPTPITQAPPSSEALKPGITGPSANPSPPGDNRSRGGVVVDGPPLSPGGGSGGTGSPTVPDPCCPKKLNLIELVFAALTDPGSNAEEMWEGPTVMPPGTDK